MKNDLTELVFVLDRSGSMFSLISDTIGGYNSMLAKQKKLAGEAFVSTVLFSDESSVLHDRVPLEKVSELTNDDYTVGGCTALLDALGDAVHHIGNVHKYARAEDVPEHTVFVIITDGMENASRRYSADRVRSMISRQREKYGWEFLFLAANIDAVQTAKRFGIREECAVNYHADVKGTAVVYDAVSAAVCCARSNGSLDNGAWRAKADRDFKNRKKA